MSKISDILGIGSEGLRAMAEVRADRLMTAHEAREYTAEIARGLPSEIEGGTGEPHPPLFLCLDLIPAFRNRPPDDADTVPKVMQWAVNAQADQFPPVSTWRVFDNLPDAEAWAEDKPTVVVMPLHIEPNPELGF